MYYRPKSEQPAKAAPDERLIVPQRLRDRLSSDQMRLHDVAGTLYWAHGNYGLGSLDREYEDAVRLYRRVRSLLDATTTDRIVQYEARRQAA